MKKIMGRNYAKMAASIALMLGAIGCTKDRPYDAVFKDDTTETSKSLIMEGEGAPATKVTDSSGNVVSVVSGEDWVYLPSTVNIDKSASSTIPHYMGEARRVRLAFTKEALRVLEVESDERFSGNLANHKSLLTIPVSHIDYRCSEDADGKCLNKEEENNEVTWDKKKYFQVQVASMATHNINFLPIEFDNLFMSCHTEVGSQFVDFQVGTDSINFQIEKTYKSSLYCASGIESLRDLSFTVRYHYSFARLSTLSTEKYTPLQYTNNDENNFGFFTTRLHKLDEDNNDIVRSESYLFKRWAPGKVVDYYLSEEFDKPENASIKAATHKAVASINASLAKADSKVRINLKDPVKGLQSGDLRNNMIVLVEDPQASGIIGYGPSAENPATGEILHARTVMYLGTMKKFLKRTYDEYVAEHLSKAKEVKSVSSLPVKLADHLIVKEMPQVSSGKENEKVERQLQNIAINSVVKGETKSHRHITSDFIDKGNFAEELHSHARNPKLHSRLSSKVEEKVEFLTSINAYPAELFNFEAAIAQPIADLIDKLGAKPWIKLTASEKAEVITTLMPHVWVPTLVHEFGHNLGLRHNFAGSEDSANFYTKEEIADMGMGTDFKYSSVMDYAYRSTNELPIMGKYDIAALRYGYAQKVELQDGTIVGLEEYRSTPGLVLKSYGYCTDEHVGANPNCNRFDEGTNLVEISEHYMEAYEARYKYANLRSDRRNFSLYDDPMYIFGINRILKGMRLIYERYEFIKNTFAIDDSDPAWGQYDFLKQLKTATHNSAAFFINILNTSDVLCGIAMADNPTTIQFILPIRELSPFAVSCFDSAEIQLNPQYLIVGEAGKSFQSRKDPSSTNAYVDQVDVRGIWADKMLATHYLTTGSLGSVMFDKFTDNYLSIPALQAPILDALAGVIGDKSQGLAIFRDSERVPLAAGFINFDITNDLKAQDTHRMLKPLHPYVLKMLKLPGRETHFQREIVQMIKRNLALEQTSGIGLALTEALEVTTSLPMDGREISEYEVATIGSTKYFTLKSSVIAGPIVKDLKALEILGQLSEETIINIALEILMEDVEMEAEEKAAAEKSLKDRKSKLSKESEQTAGEAAPVQRTAIELEAKALGLETLQRYLQGEIKSQSFLEKTVVYLSEGIETVQ